MARIVGTGPVPLHQHAQARSDRAKYAISAAPHIRTATGRASISPSFTSTAPQIKPVLVSRWRKLAAIQSGPTSVPASVVKSAPWGQNSHRFPERAAGHGAHCEWKGRATPRQSRRHGRFAPPIYALYQRSHPGCRLSAERQCRVRNRTEGPYRVRPMLQAMRPLRHARECKRRKPADRSRPKANSPHVAPDWCASHQATKTVATTWETGCPCCKQLRVRRNQKST